MSTSALLAKVSGIVSSVAGPLLFKPGIVVARGARTSDGRGGSDYAQVVMEVQLLKVDKRKNNETATPAQTGKAANFLILAQGLPNAVRPGAYIAHNGLAYSIISIKRDPANAVLDCACERVGIYKSSGKDIEIIIEA